MIHTDIVTGKTQADGLFIFSLQGVERLSQVQLQISVSATPDAGTLTISGRSPGANTYVVIGTIDLTDSSEYIFNCDYYLDSVKITPASFDAVKTYSVALYSGAAHIRQAAAADTALPYQLYLSNTRGRPYGTALIEMRRTVSADQVDAYGFDDSPGYQLSLGSTYTNYDELIYLPTFYDQSGKTHNFVQTTASNQPKLFWEGLTFGSNVVAEHDFSTDTGSWTKQAGWTIGSGVASFSIGGAATSLYQLLSISENWKAYEISVDLTISSGTISVKLGGSATPVIFDTSAIYTFQAYASAASPNFFITGSAGAVGTIDNVTVKPALTYNDAPVLGFDGVDDYLSTPYHADFNLRTNPFSIEFDMYYDSIPTLYDTPFGIGGFVGDGVFLGYDDGAWQTETGKWLWRLRDGVLSNVFLVNTIPKFQWNNIKLTFDGTTYNSYVNDVLQDSYSAGVFDFQMGYLTNVYAGCGTDDSTNRGYFFNGLIKNLIVQK